MAHDGQIFSRRLAAGLRRTLLLMISAVAVGSVLFLGMCSTSYRKLHFPLPGFLWLYKTSSGSYQGAGFRLGMRLEALRWWHSRYIVLQWRDDDYASVQSNPSKWNLIDAHRRVQVEFDREADMWRVLQAVASVPPEDQKLYGVWEAFRVREKQLKFRFNESSLGRLRKAQNDLLEIAEGIAIYWQTHGVVPSDLSQLAPYYTGLARSDPWGAPYLYAGIGRAPDFAATAHADDESYILASQGGKGMERITLPSSFPKYINQRFRIGEPKTVSVHVFLATADASPPAEPPSGSENLP